MQLLYVVFSVQSRVISVHETSAVYPAAFQFLEG
jgi:hypothetical protein